MSQQLRASQYWTVGRKKNPGKYAGILMKCVWVAGCRFNHVWLSMKLNRNFQMLVWIIILASLHGYCRGNYCKKKKEVLRAVETSPLTCSTFPADLLLRWIYVWVKNKILSIELNVANPFLFQSDMFDKKQKKEICRNIHSFILSFSFSLELVPLYWNEFISDKRLANVYDLFSSKQAKC